MRSSLSEVDPDLEYRAHDARVHEGDAQRQNVTVDRMFY
jgi:hypothetical protein